MHHEGGVMPGQGVSSVDLQHAFHGWHSARVQRD